MVALRNRASRGGSATMGTCQQIHKRKMRVEGIKKGNHVETKREDSKVPGR